MRKRIKKILRTALKALLSIEYILGFLPVFFINYFLNLIRKPKNDKEFYKRILYIQTLAFPSIIAGLIIFLEVWSQSLIVAGLMNFLSLLYILGVIYFQYEDDDYVNFVSSGDLSKKIKLKRRLISIKCITFFAVAFIIGFFLPRHYISFMIN